MIYIAHFHMLYRGPDPTRPTEKWDCKSLAWRPYDSAVPTGPDWGVEISEEAAQEIMDRAPNDWRNGPYGPAAQDRMDAFEHAVMTGEIEPLGTPAEVVNGRVVPRGLTPEERAEFLATPPAANDQTPGLHEVLTDLFGPPANPDADPRHRRWVWSPPDE